MKRVVFVFFLLILADGSARLPQLAALERSFHADVGSRLSARDSQALAAECLDRLPASIPRGAAGSPVTAVVSEPWHQGRRLGLTGEIEPTWTLVRVTLEMHGIEIAGASSVFIFDSAEDRLVAYEHPEFPHEAFSQDPGLPSVPSAEAEAVVVDALLRDRWDDYDLRVTPLLWSLDTSCYVHPVLFARRWRPGESASSLEHWTLHWGLVDGQNSRLLASGSYSLQIAVTGQVRGSVVPFAGAAVRRAQSVDNPPVERPLPYIPLEFRGAGGPRLGPALTGPQGEFEFLSPTEGNWGATTRWSTDEFAWVALPETQAVSASASGVGDLHVELSLTDERAEQLDRENAAGNLTGWIYLHHGKRVAEMLRDRNLRWPKGVGAGGEFLRGFPAWYTIQYVPLAAGADEIPICGAYFDAFPPDRRIGISQANGVFAHCAGPAAWHEEGHALISAFTGQINEAGPQTHDLTVEEGVADFWSVLIQQFSDPDGEIHGDIGLGKKLGQPACFQRNVVRGEVGIADADPSRACEEVGGFGLFPQKVEPHAASLPISGFWTDVLRGFLAKYGRDAGLLRAADTFVRWIDFHRGGHMPAFRRSSVFEVLAVNDSPDFGGNDIPQDGSPDGEDVIVPAAARHNFWLLAFLRGDANLDRQVDISDALAILDYLFLGQPAPGCLDAADADDSGAVDLSDAVNILGFLFLAREGLPPPHGCFEIDPTPDDGLTCEAYGACRA